MNPRYEGMPARSLSLCRRFRDRVSPPGRGTAAHSCRASIRPAARYAMTPLGATANRRAMPLAARARPRARIASPRRVKGRESACEPTAAGSTARAFVSTDPFGSVSPTSSSAGAVPPAPFSEPAGSSDPAGSSEPTDPPPGVVPEPEGRTSSPVSWSGRRHRCRRHCRCRWKRRLRRSQHERVRRAELRPPARSRWSRWPIVGRRCSRSPESCRRRVPRVSGQTAPAPRPER